MARADPAGTSKLGFCHEAHESPSLICRTSIARFLRARGVPGRAARNPPALHRSRGCTDFPILSACPRKWCLAASSSPSCVGAEFCMAGSFPHSPACILQCFFLRDFAAKAESGNAVPVGIVISAVVRNDLATIQTEPAFLVTENYDVVLTRVAHSLTPPLLNLPGFSRRSIPR